MRTPHLLSSLLVIVVASAAGGCQATSPAESAQAAPASSGPYTAAASQVTLQGEITALDRASRAVTVTGSDGASLEFIAGPAVRNFGQLQVGDKVSLDFEEAVALELQPAGSAQLGVSTAEGGAVAPAGGKPGGAMSDTVSLVTEVVAVDPVAHTIALKGPRGNTQLISVQREDLRARLPKVKKGDLLRISYTEAVAVSIRPAGS
ncbi:MAG TPA: hypothetical protein VD865_17395 [Stenotrophomonas sp.]|nr:hypothetical protein [Stenotrophomonas sp.]